jgi:predicted phosphodiesterase
MRIAALYDIHGNLPALDAVLADVARAAVDRIVIGGDVLPGPMPRDTMERLASLQVPTAFLRGNGDRETLEESPERPSRIPESVREQLRWCRAQLTDAQVRDVDGWPPTVRLDVPTLGSVLFCHATPRSDDEVVTHLIPAPLLQPIVEDAADVVVCGHIHVQFDTMVGRTRLVNAGSVGMPFEKPGAYWLLLDDGALELRRTLYDLDAAASRVRHTAFPQAEQFASTYILNPPDMLQTFTQYGLEALKAASSHGA